MYPQLCLKCFYLWKLTFEPLGHEMIIQGSRMSIQCSRMSLHGSIVSLNGSRKRFQSSRTSVWASRTPLWFMSLRAWPGLKYEPLKFRDVPPGLQDEPAELLNDLQGLRMSLRPPRLRFRPLGWGSETSRWASRDPGWFYLCNMNMQNKWKCEPMAQIGLHSSGLSLQWWRRSLQGYMLSIQGSGLSL